MTGLVSFLEVRPWEGQSAAANYPLPPTVPSEGTVGTSPTVPNKHITSIEQRTDYDLPRDTNRLNGRTEGPGFPATALTPTVPSEETAPTKNAHHHTLQTTVPLVYHSSSSPTVPTEPTVPDIECDSQRPSQPAGQGTYFSGGSRPFRCLRAQDGHSYAEDRLYNALWNARVVLRESENSRIVTVGWDVMGQWAGMDWKTARRNCLTLIDKLAVERVQEHNSNTRTGTTYRVFSYQAILVRRRQAGLLWAVRNRGGVKFIGEDNSLHASLTPTVPSEQRVTTQPTETVPIQPSPTPPTQPPLIVREEESNLLQSEVALVLAALQGLDPTIDDEAAEQLMLECRRARSSVTAAQIAHFIPLKARAATIKTSVFGFLRTSLPKFFRSSAYLASAQIVDRNERGDDTIRRRQAAELLADPTIDDAVRDWARKILAAEQGSA